jgi:hypothetical protein
MLLSTRKRTPIFDTYKEIKYISLSNQKRGHISKKSAVEMLFSKSKILKWMETDFSLTIQKPVD